MGLITMGVRHRPSGSSTATIGCAPLPPPSSSGWPVPEGPPKALNGARGQGHFYGFKAISRGCQVAGVHEAALGRQPKPRSQHDGHAGRFVHDDRLANHSRTFCTSHPRYPWLVSPNRCCHRRKLGRGKGGLESAKTEERRQRPLSRTRSRATCPLSRGNWSRAMDRETGHPRRQKRQSAGGASASTVRCARALPTALLRAKLRRR